MALKDLVVKFRADLSGIDAGIQKLNAKQEEINKQMASKYNALSQEARSVGLALTASVTLPIVATGKAAIDAYMRMDSLQRGMEAVMGSSRAAAQEMQNLREVAKLPGLGFEEAIQGSVNLQAAGMSAKDARDSLMAFGNALALVGRGKDDLAGVNVQLVQMAGKSKLMMEDIRIIQQYVPQLSAAMRKLYGTTDAEVISKMGITPQKFIADITKELSKLPKMTGGIKNDFENMSDNINVALSKAGKSMERFVSPAIQKVSDLAVAFQNVSPGTQTFITVMAGGAAAIGPTLGVLSYLPPTINRIKMGMDLLKGGWETTALKAMYASDAIRTFATAVKAEGVAAIGKMIAANNQLSFSFSNVVKPAIAAALIEITLFMNAIVKAESEAEQAIQKLNELPDKLRAENVQRFQRQLESSTDAQLRNRLKTVQDEMAKWTRILKYNEKRDNFFHPEAHIGAEAAQQELNRLDEYQKAIQAEQKKRRESLSNANKPKEMLPAEQSALMDIAALQKKLSGDHWAYERAAAKAEHDKQIAELDALAKKTGESVVYRKQEVDLQYKAQVKEINNEQQQEAIQARKDRIDEIIKNAQQAAEKVQEMRENATAETVARFQTIADAAKAKGDQLKAAYAQAQGAYTQEMSTLEELARKGVDVRQRMAAALQGYKTAIIEANKEEQRRQNEIQTQKLERMKQDREEQLRSSKEKIDAIKREAEEEKQKMLQQVGWQSLRQRSQNAMVAGEKYRFWEPKQTAQPREDYQELKKQNTLLESILKTLDKKLDALKAVSVIG